MSYRKILLLCLALAASVTASVSHAQERPYMKVGPWQILDIDENGEFSRCSASVITKTGMVRIHNMASGTWAVSIPRGNIPRRESSLADIDFGGDSAQVTITADANERASFDVDRPMLDGLKTTNRLRVSVLGKAFVWDLRNVGAAIGAVEECRLKALRR